MSKHRIGWTKKQLLAHIVSLEQRLADPEGEIQRGLNARYTRDLRERELKHHAAWDEEIRVMQGAAARRMRGLAADVARRTDAEMTAEIEALPLYPGEQL